MIAVAKPQIGPEEEAAVLAVLRSGMIAQGPQTERFEHAFAELCDVQHAVAVSNGTVALHLALLAHDIGPGDEVITSPFSFIATANSILMTGARPVFVDIDADDFNLDPTLVEAAITPRTRAIMPVHLYGQPAQMDALLALAQRYNLQIIEDAAQAVGACYRGRPAGSFGTACFSLYATKNITTGEGGMITTNDAAIAERLRLLRAHGMRVRYYHEHFGYNFRITDLQSALGLAQLGKLATFNQRRIANAAYLDAHISHPAISTPRVRPEVRHVYHQYTVRVQGGREAAIKQLAAAGVGAAIFYPLTIPQQPFYRAQGYEVPMPVAEQAARDVLALPVHPGLSAEELAQVADAVNALELVAELVV
ncbi:DegT/DnrJ/EryC1/StrS family aminotransferase [Candidatus Gracilibacteria bacterium]|nr:DegT/DnrJ/EryC1/StrS family aminotransferase [Candidatus Gracilibacteria bacterium]